jgi:hypothetical protein
MRSNDDASRLALLTIPISALRLASKKSVWESDLHMVAR